MHLCIGELHLRTFFLHSLRLCEGHEELINHDRNKHVDVRGNVGNVVVADIDVDTEQ